MLCKFCDAIFEFWDWAKSKFSRKQTPFTPSPPVAAPEPAPVVTKLIIKYPKKIESVLKQKGWSCVGINRSKKTLWIAITEKEFFYSNPIIDALGDCGPIIPPRITDSILSKLDNLYPYKFKKCKIDYSLNEGIFNNWSIIFRGGYCDKELRIKKELEEESRRQSYYRYDYPPTFSVRRPYSLYKDKLKRDYETWITTKAVKQAKNYIKFELV